MEMTVKTIASNIMEFSAQHIAVTLWAVAKLDYNPGKDILQVCTLSNRTMLAPQQKRPLKHFVVSDAKAPYNVLAGLCANCMWWIIPLPTLA